MPEPQPPSLQRLARAAALGLLGACAIGGLVLLTKGAMAILSPLDCGTRPSSDCALEQQLGLHWGRRQTLVGGALLLLALAIFAWLRSKSPRSDGN